MTVPILNEASQQRILLSYEKNYGSLVLAYNNLKNNWSVTAINTLKNKANALCVEMEKDVDQSRGFFSEESTEFAGEIIKQIKWLTDTYLTNHQNNDKLSLHQHI